jgi:hypothetical protein
MYVTQNLGNSNTNDCKSAYPPYAQDERDSSPVFVSEVDCTVYFAWATVAACAASQEQVACSAQGAGGAVYDLAPLMKQRTDWEVPDRCATLLGEINVAPELI